MRGRGGRKKSNFQSSDDKDKNKTYSKSRGVIEVEEMEQEEVEYSQEDASIVMMQAISPLGFLNGRKTKGEIEELIFFMKKQEKMRKNNPLNFIQKKESSYRWDEAIEYKKIQIYSDQIVSFKVRYASLYLIQGKVMMCYLMRLLRN